MTRLFTYCLRYDDGAAPNPYWGVCTLAICKPRVRRAAQLGDWIVGTGSVGDGTAGKIVYAMKVSNKLPMAEYDTYTATELPDKIPDWTHADVRRRLGDSIYDFSGGSVRQRKGVHGSANMPRDLGGQFARIRSASHVVTWGVGRRISSVHGTRELRSVDKACRALA